MLTIDGLATGFDTASIIEGLQQFQQRQIDLLESRRTKEVQRQTAFKGVEAQVLSFRSTASRLGRTTGNVFSARAVSSSDETALTATASSGAAPGIYSVTVNQLAQAHQIGSQGLSGENAEITQGTFSFRVGNGAQTDITVDSSNNSLRALANAVNDADAGVRASIINDGSATNGYRLLLSAEKTGADNAITITNSLAADNGNAVRPDFSGAAIQDAVNSSLTLGSGAGAITVENSTNTVEDLLDGVTLQLGAADVTRTISLQVSRDTEAAASAVRDFVDGFNRVMEFIDENSRFNIQSQQGGVLLGNRQAQTIQDDLRAAVTDTVSGVNPNANRLSAIGISITDAGTLVLNESRLSEVLAGRVAEVSDDDLSRLFSFSGDTTNSNVRFVGGSTRTAAGVPIEVDITQAATQAVALGTNDLAASTIIDGTNDELTLEINGTSATVSLLHGTYDQASLAELVQNTVNAVPELTGRPIIVGVEGSKLRMISETYGRVSQLEAFTGSALSAIGFDGSESARGQDTVGQFIINGETETAIGRGRILTGDLDNEYAADLQVSVTLTESQVQAGNDATLTLTRGIGSRLDQLIGRLTDSNNGRIKVANDEFEAKIDDLKASIDRQNELFEQRRESLIAEFVALESAVSQLQGQANFLSAQLGGLPAAPGIG